MLRWLKAFGILTTFGTYVILVMGAVVTKTESGEGCGRSWPLCHGELIPSSVNIELLIEYSHRIVSAFVGLTVLIFGIWAVLALPKRPLVKWFAFGSIFFIVFQGGLGAGAVVWGQSDLVLALHFGFSLLCFTGVLLLTFEVFKAGKSAGGQISDVSNKFRFVVWSSVVYVYIVVYTGAYVRHADAVFGCKGWPLCNGKVIPPLTGIEGIHFGHRVASLLSLILIAYMFVLARQFRERRDVYWGSAASFILIILQTLSGALAVWSDVNLVTSLIHSTLVACLFGVLCYVALQARKSVGEGQYAAEAAEPENVPV